MLIDPSLALFSVKPNTDTHSTPPAHEFAAHPHPMAASDLPADEFQAQFGDLIDGALGLFSLDDDTNQNDVDKVLVAEQRVKEWRAETKHRVDQARDDLRGASLDARP